MNRTVGRAARMPAFLHLFRIVLLAALLTPAQLYAAAFGSVRGVVHDPQERPVTEATVSLKAAASDWMQATKTDAQGEFVFSSVAIGDYTLIVSEDQGAELRVPAGAVLTVRVAA